MKRWACVAKVIEAAPMRLVGAADGPASVYLASKLTPDLIDPNAVAAASPPSPKAARIVQEIAREEDLSNYLLDQATAPNLAGLIASVLTAGMFWMWVV